MYSSEATNTEANMYTKICTYPWFCVYLSAMLTHSGVCLVTDTKQKTIPKNKIKKHLSFPEQWIKELISKVY